MSKEVEWSSIHGKGEIVCTCDQCYDEERIGFEDGYPNFEDVAKDLFKMYESFVKAGFNKTQAFYLTSEILKGGLKNG